MRDSYAAGDVHIGWATLDMLPLIVDGFVDASGNPRDKMRVFFNYMSHPDDLTEFRAAIRLSREIFAQAAFDPYRGPEIAPGEESAGGEARTSVRQRSSKPVR